MEASVDNEVIVNAVGTVEVAVGNAANAVVADDHALDITVTKKEYKIVGDEVYIAKLYEDAPQWMKDLVQLVVDNTMETESAMLRNDLIKQLNQFATSYVPLNQYTQSILDLSNADTAMHATLETLNSNFNDGLDTANSQIIDLQSTKASKTEVATKVIETLTAQLATPTSELGATIGNLQQTIVDGDSANADSVTTLMSVLEGEVDARASAIETINTYVGIDEAGASTGTGLSAYLEGSDGTIGGADSQVANSVAIVGGVPTSKWQYNSALVVNGTTYNSGFGLSNSAGTGIGSEFWIDASRLKFTNSAKTGSTAPFTIDASGATPQITFNGKVSFSNVTNVPQLGSTPQEVVTAINSGNTTTIDGGKITTGSIAANQIAAGTITGDKIAADAINGKTITGTLINGGVINGVNINGSVIKASWIDYSSTGTLTNWAYYTPATMPAQYSTNFAHDSLTGALITDSNGFVRLPKVSKVTIGSFLYNVGTTAGVYTLGNASFAGYDLDVRSFDDYTTTSTRRLLNANTRIVFDSANIPFLYVSGGSGHNGRAVGTCNATWRIGTDVFVYYGLSQATNQGADPHIYTTRLSKNNVYLMNVTTTIPSGGALTSVTYYGDIVSCGIATRISAYGARLSVVILNAINDTVGYIGTGTTISVGACDCYASDNLNAGIKVYVPTGTESY